MAKLDARKRYTQMILKQSFLKLLKEKPVNKITVKELCELSQINRATFYTHYSDCFALLESIDADSALDYSTAAALRQALRRDFPGTTLVIISERVSAVREADCILVLENGRIDAQGCHDALMASCRRYQRMAKLQMGGDVG